MSAINDPQAHPETFAFSSKEKQAKALKLAKDLRCPQCQNQNLMESNSPVAQDLRLKVYEKVEEGKNEEEIIRYMIQRFGDMAYYQPPLTPSTAILWAGPGLVMLLFGWVIIKKMVKEGRKR